MGTPFSVGCGFKVGHESIHIAAKMGLEAAKCSPQRNLLLVCREWQRRWKLSKGLDFIVAGMKEWKRTCKHYYIFQVLAGAAMGTLPSIGIHSPSLLQTTVATSKEKDA